MAKHNNPSIVQDLQRIFNAKVGQLSSSEITEILQPVIIIERPITFSFATGSLTASGNSTIFTAVTNKDTYLVGATISFDKDVSSDNTSVSITAVLNGATRFLYIGVGITLTAQQDSIVLQFPKPIKVDRGSPVILTGTFTVGALSRASCVWGYEVETVSTATQ